MLLESQAMTSVLETMARAYYEKNMAIQRLIDGPFVNKKCQTWEEVDYSTRAIWTGTMRAALRAAEEAGFVMVPKEPTREMLTRACNEVDKPSYMVTRGYIDEDDCRNAYIGALAAAPKVTE